MDILVCIASYGDSHREYLHQLLSEYREMRYNVDVIVDTTPEKADEKWPNHVIDVQIYSPEIKEGLAYVHRETMVERADQYDLYIYSEDDILITEQNIEAYLFENEHLCGNEVPGFLRYEKRDDDPARYLLDCHPQPRWYHPLDRNPNRRVILDAEQQRNGREYFSLWNLHQGCWILTDDQLQRALKSGGGFKRSPGDTKHRPKWWRSHQHYGTLESGASDIYTRCGFAQKLYPKEGLERLLIKHLPNKYVSGSRMPIKGIRTLEDLKEEVGASS